MRKSYVNNTFCLLGAALALSLKSTLAGAGPVSAPPLPCDAPVPYAKIAAGPPATATARPTELRG